VSLLLVERGKNHCLWQRRFTNTIYNGGQEATARKGESRCVCVYVCIPVREDIYDILTLQILHIFTFLIQLLYRYAKTSNG